MVIRRKIKDKEPQSLIKTDTSAQKSKDQEIKDEQFSLSDKKVFLNPDKDAPRFDETGTSKGYSRDALATNPEIADSKKVKSLESIEKQAHRELPAESKQSDQTAYSEFIEEDTAENEIAATDVNPIQIIAAEDQKPSTLHEKPSTETKTEIQEIKESSVSSYPVYYISAVELVPDPASGKNASTESVKTKSFAYENANRVQNTFEPKVIEVEESYYPDAKETATVTPARSKKTKTDFVETNQKVLKKKQPSVYAAAAPIVTSTEKKTDHKRIQDTGSQWKEALSLAAKEKDLKENFKSEDTIVEVEIEVANGNGVNGAAGRFGTYLKSKGFKVAKV
ncbi:MAG: LytR C-terminal domain-containing protein, partial [Desulfobacterales bacterium]|nr:LytR C-terminal domain-containing protein [Desulfobacterales bacterium]